MNMGKRAANFASCLPIAAVALAAGMLAYALVFQSLPCAGCNAKVSFVFSPQAEDDVVLFLSSAKKTIDIEMYTFTSDAALRAIGDAIKRGVQVRIILEPRVDDSRQKKTFDTLLALGAKARWASIGYRLTHSKFVLVDGKKALVGSINFSKNALNYNREAGVLVEGEIVKDLSAIFEEDWAEATEGK
jgi:phosphatidylserine/phosphatidylglycerophosphate/cardiolipin synthase-like enzyme